MSQCSRCNQAIKVWAGDWTTGVHWRSGMMMFRDSSRICDPLFNGSIFDRTLSELELPEFVKLNGQNAHIGWGQYNEDYELCRECHEGLISAVGAFLNLPQKHKAFKELQKADANISALQEAISQPRETGSIAHLESELCYVKNKKASAQRAIKSPMQYSL